MKIRMTYFIILLSFIFVAFSCDKDNDSQDTEECEYIGRYSDILGKVIINDTFITTEGDTDYVWAIDISKIAFNTSCWTIDSAFAHYGVASDSILAPEESLPDTFREDNMRIIFSADRYNCCDRLTQPNFRGWYGCKIDITEISEYD